MAAKEQTGFFDILRTLDESELDVYQFRLLTHVWRRGVCYDKIRTLAKVCKMSIGKASETMNWLEANGYIEKAAKDGRVGYQMRSPDEQEPDNQAEKRSPHEQNVHHTNRTFTTRTERSPHEQDVQDMNAILNRPKQIDLVNRPSEKGEPPKPPLPASAPELSAEDAALADMVNALGDVTGMSPRMNWAVLSAAAGDLLDNDYTAGQVASYYGREVIDGCWNWYLHDWRGKRGEFPSPKHIRETIRGAVKWRPPPAAQMNGHVNGRKLSRSEQAAEEYATLKAQFLGIQPAGET